MNSNCLRLLQCNSFLPLQKYNKNHKEPKKIKKIMIIVLHKPNIIRNFAEKLAKT